MKRKTLVISGSILGVLVCLFILAGPPAPLLQKLGVPVFCTEGNFPNLKFVSCGQSSPLAMSATPMPLPTLDPQGPIPIIVDDDGSPDGMVALLYFLSNPLFDIRAVTVSYGEAHPEVFAPKVAQLLAGLGRTEIPVGAGRETPLEGNNAFPEPWRETSDNFWDIKLPKATVSKPPSSASQLIVDTITQSNRPVVIFVSGSLTNLADALRKQPGIVQNIQAIYVMGGALHVDGNIQTDWSSIQNSVAEWNIWVDPVAASEFFGHGLSLLRLKTIPAREAFGSGLSIHLVPLDATRKVLWRRADLTVWNSFDSEEGALAARLLNWMLDSWQSDNIYIWDLVAAIHATNTAICPETPLAVDIVIAPGPEQGRMLVTEDTENVDVCLDPDQEQVKALAASILGR